MTKVEIALTFLRAFGGIAVFVFGMHVLSSNLEKAAGERIEKMLRTMTDNVIKGILLGTLITAFVHSSGAVTVITVGLVNAGLLTLRNAAGIVMGANIGTCVTPLIIALGDITGMDTGSVLSFLEVESIAPVLAGVGIIMFMASKADKYKIFGEVLIGAAILFYGMITLMENVKKFAGFPIFEKIFASMENPIVGILVGTLFTAAIQSSTAATAILQSVAATGVLSFSAAFPLIMGFNIGTTVTSVISSIGTSRNAKRTAMMHVWFNMFGTVSILILMYIVQGFAHFGFWDDPINMAGIAMFGLWFNIANMVEFLPCPGFLVWLSGLGVSDKADENEIADENNLDPRFLISPSIALQQALNAVVTMGELAKINVADALKLYDNYDPKLAGAIKEREDIIDKTEDRLNSYLVKITEQPLGDMENRSVTALLRLLLEFERIGDYAVNLCDRADYLNKKNIRFSDSAHAELMRFGEAIDEILGMAVNAVNYSDLNTSISIEPLEEVIDQMADNMREKHIERLKSGVCSIDRGITFLNNITDMERISDHCSNIAVYVMGKISRKDAVNRHEYIKRIHKGEIAEYAQAQAEFKEKYIPAAKN